MPITSKSGPGDLQNASKSIPGSPNAPSQPNLTLETSKVLQNRSLEAQVSHQIQIWRWRPSKCFKINLWRPKCLIRSKSGPGDFQNASKSTSGDPRSNHLQIWPWRPPKCFKIDPWTPKCTTRSKSGPGDLQNASKSIPRGPTGHQLQIWALRPLK